MRSPVDTTIPCLTSASKASRSPSLCSTAGAAAPITRLSGTKARSGSLRWNWASACTTFTSISLTALAPNQRSRRPAWTCPSVRNPSKHERNSATDSPHRARISLNSRPAAPDLSNSSRTTSFTGRDSRCATPAAPATFFRLGGCGSTIVPPPMTRIGEYVLSTNASSAAAASGDSSLSWHNADSPGLKVSPSKSTIRVITSLVPWWTRKRVL